ncbi:MAG: hypothetical protein KDH20_21690 [Rhodocyclaceae bacterium]|nr:hypothetical protein [Rhodocyclaceae bacterium]
MAVSSAMAGDDDVPTVFTERGSIANTRHNLTQLAIEDPRPGTSAQMDPSRNNYGEVCVYCHTPHGANTRTSAPLWNRTQLDQTYQTYDELGTSTLTQTFTQPGVNSLTCLSCHDGVTAIDSIINMPGSGGYDKSAENQVIEVNHLNDWTNASGVTTGNHAALNESGCIACHTPDGLGATLFAAADNFTLFQIGTDLRNDHPVGVTFPLGNPTDFNTTNIVTNTRGDAFMDANGNSRMDKGEVRFYETGDGPEVECASCHDPHGVESAGAGSDFNPTFLRIANDGSQLCLTCHIK